MSLCENLSYHIIVGKNLGHCEIGEKHSTEEREFLVLER